jgi:hypothetical protein
MVISETRNHRRGVELYTSAIRDLVLRVILRVIISPVVHTIVNVVPDTVVNNEVVFC